MSIHHNGHATGARITGIRTRPRDLTGPGFSLRVDPQTDGVTVQVTGTPAPEQVLRLLSQNHVLHARARARIDVCVTTAEGYDRYLYTGDLQHRLLFSRGWNRRGITGAFYGLNPFVGDTDGPVDRVPARPSFRNIVGVLAKQGPVRRVDIMNLFTRRTKDAATLLADLDDRVADPALEREVLASVDYVIPAWGSKVTPRHEPAVRSMLGVCREVGKVPHLRAKHGRILVAGHPPQPTHPRMEGYREVELVPAPASWLGGRHLEASWAPPAQRPHPPAHAERLAPPVADTRLPPPPPHPGTSVPQPPPDEAPSPPSAHARKRPKEPEVLDWARQHLDEVGAEAVRRYLQGERFGDVHPDLPGPEALAARALERGKPWDVLDLAVTAHRVVSGIAWRWIGARHLLKKCDLPPDLQDRRADGRKVTGKPYADAARQVISHLARVPGVVGNTLAPATRRNVDFATIANEWGVSDALVGATVGPGAAIWLDPSTRELVGHRNDDTYYRVTDQVQL